MRFPDKMRCKNKYAGLDDLRCRRRRGHHGNHSRLQWWELRRRWRNR